MFCACVLLYLPNFRWKLFFYYYFVVESNVVGCTKYEIAWTTRVRAQFHRNEENKKCAFFDGMCTVLSFLSLYIYIQEVTKKMFSMFMRCEPVFPFICFIRWKIFGRKTSSIRAKHKPIPANDLCSMHEPGSNISYTR